uniref:Chaperone SurA n=1 Tax=Magnetococcus massalia (strain MO-1) TaxID=451514 RepID=A0A1S7LJ94_MAGMO|nr:putative peptidyl-prolyl cis-trans isomerase (PPIase) [Candidatus Magnetococcus massalia]
MFPKPRKLMMPTAQSRLLTTTLFIALVCLTVASDLRAEALDRIAAVVEGDIILESEVAAKVRPLMAKLQRNDARVNPMAVRKKVLDGLVMQMLRLDKAKKLGIKVTNQEVERLASEMAKRNGVELGQFKKMLASQGVPYELYLQSLRDRLLQRRIIGRVISPMIQITEEEVRDLYSSTRTQEGQGELALQVGQIFFAVPENATTSEIARFEERARKVHAELETGRSFTVLASEHSDDPSGLNGGDMGWFKKGELIPTMERAVFALEKGAYSQPVRSPVGLHIFTVLDQRRGESKAASSSTSEGGKVMLKARHILLKVPANVSPEDSADVREDLLDLRNKLKAGETFETLAKEYSEDAETADKGGVLPPFGRGQHAASFEDVAFFLKPGVVSDPVRSPAGWHLILVDERQVAHQSDAYESVRQELQTRVREAKTKALYSQWLRDLRMQSYVEIR